MHFCLQTYGEITFAPGPRLNLILGPNGAAFEAQVHPVGYQAHETVAEFHNVCAGTGKSSLVCALCVGLGGAPKVRACKDESLASLQSHLFCMVGRPARRMSELRHMLHRLQLLGRSEQIADYVRRGCNEGFTEIHLSGGEGRNAGSIIVMRRIKSDGTSQWKLNGADVQLIAGQVFL